VLQILRGHQLTSGSDGEGALDGTELLVSDERGVGGVTDVNLTGLEETADVLGWSASFQ
jgi:hypothetical protein